MWGISFVLKFPIPQSTSETFRCFILHQRSISPSIAYRAVPPKEMSRMTFMAHSQLVRLSGFLYAPSNRLALDMTESRWRGGKRIGSIGHWNNRYTLHRNLISTPLPPTVIPNDHHVAGIRKHDEISDARKYAQRVMWGISFVIKFPIPKSTKALEVFPYQSPSPVRNKPPSYTGSDGLNGLFKRRRCLAWLSWLTPC